MGTGLNSEYTFLQVARHQAHGYGFQVDHNGPGVFIGCECGILSFCYREITELFTSPEPR